jgi:hypothetical protein
MFSSWVPSPSRPAKPPVTYSRQLQTAVTRQASSLMAMAVPRSKAALPSVVIMSAVTCAPARPA